jgi:hypothetical protein
MPGAAISRACALALIAALLGTGSCTTSGTGQAEPVPAHHRAARGRLPPAAVGFMLIDWCDTLHFERAMAAQPRRPGCPLPEDDLVLRAARRCKRPPAPQGATSASTSAFRHRPAWAAARRTQPVLPAGAEPAVGPELTLSQLARSGLSLGATCRFSWRAQRLGGGHRRAITPLDLPRPLCGGQTG